MKFLLRRPWRIPEILLTRLPFFQFIRETDDYQNRINLGIWFRQKVLGRGGNRDAYWPVSEYSQVYDAEKIRIGVDVCPGLMKGCYIQGYGGITIGDFTQIGPNAGIISANHDPCDLRERCSGSVTIGAYCWIGMNAVILPGVELGDFTIVGAGAVVTRSFPQGFQVIGGNPAKTLRTLNPDQCVRHSVRRRFIGYLTEAEYLRRQGGADRLTESGK